MSEPDSQTQESRNEKQSDSGDARDRRGKRIVALVFYFLVIAVWLLIHFFNRGLTSKREPVAGQARYKMVEVPSGATLTDIANSLVEEQVLGNKLVFTMAATARRSTRSLKAGDYRFDTSLSPLEILTWLERGNVTLHRFTIPEGFTVKKIAARLENMGLVKAEDLMRLSIDPDFCEELGIGGNTLEGYLFPDTYRIAKGLPPERVVKIMVDRFWTLCSDEIPEETLLDKARFHDIIKMASIVEKEALYDDEMPLIAGVIQNRLKLKMPLQCDVTIRYPLDNYGIHLTYSDLRMESPYNSYLHKGLPPTPICNPGLEAIKAAYSPKETDFLYFVSMNNGRHKFSSSLKDHNKAVFKYQILNERG